MGVQQFTAPSHASVAGTLCPCPCAEQNLVLVYTSTPLLISSVLGLPGKIFIIFYICLRTFYIHFPTFSKCSVIVFMSSAINYL